MRFVEIIRNDIFKKSLKDVIVFTCIFIILGLITGATIHEISTPIVKFIMNGNLASSAMTTTRDVPLMHGMVLFFNNAFISGMILLISGIFSRVSFTSTWFNKSWIVYFLLGYQIFIVSCFTGFATGILNIVLILAALAPHGIIEIPMVLITSTLGISMFDNSFPFSKGEILKFFIVIIVPCLFIAAMMESFITPFVMGLV
jgi:uncharacterized membrane protein SpoIIM required for sporulation